MVQEVHALQDAVIPVQLALEVRAKRIGANSGGMFDDDVDDIFAGSTTKLLSEVNGMTKFLDLVGGPLTSVRKVRGDTGGANDIPKKLISIKDPRTRESLQLLLKSR